MTSVKIYRYGRAHGKYFDCSDELVGKLAIESVIETKASTILQFIHGLNGDLRVTFEEGTWAAWLYDLLKQHVTGSAGV